MSACPARHVCAGNLGRARARAVAGPRPAGQKAALLFQRPLAAGLRFRDQMPAGLSRRAVRARRLGPAALPHLRLRPRAGYPVRGHSHVASRLLAARRQWRRGGTRILVAAHSTRRGDACIASNRTRGHFCPPRPHPRSRAPAPHQRRAAGRVPLRRVGLQRHRGPHGRGRQRPGENIRHRLQRRTLVRRNRPRRGPTPRYRASRVHRPARRR